MTLSDQQLLDALSWMPFVDSMELALILGEPHATVHRTLSNLLAEGIVGRVSHGTAHLPSSGRYCLTASGVRESTDFLGFATPSDFVRAYPMSREWLTLLIRRMDAVASVYRLAATMSPGTDGRRTRVEFHRRGHFDAVITLHDGRDFGVVRQGLALRRRSLHDRLRALAAYDSSRRPDVVLILVPSVWERRLTGRFCDRVLSQGLLHRRGVQVGIGTTGPPRLAGDHRVDRDTPTIPWSTWSPRAGPAGDPPPRRRSANGPPYPTLSGWRRPRPPSACRPRRSGPLTSSPTTR